MSRLKLSQDVEFYHVNGYFLYYTDFAQGTRQALSHMIGLGYQSIGYLDGANEPNIHYPRYITFRSLLEEQGLYDPNLVELKGKWNAKSGYDMAKVCLEKAHIARAYFVANVPMAVGAMRAFSEAGLRIPEDVHSSVSTRSLICQPTSGPRCRASECQLKSWDAMASIYCSMVLQTTSYRSLSPYRQGSSSARVAAFRYRAHP